MVKIKKRYKPLYKKFLRLRVNPLNNNKFVRIKVEEKIKVIRKKKIKIKQFKPIPNKKLKRKKWKTFIISQIKKYKFHQKFKPFTFHSSNVSKFASPGNSFKKNFRNDLFTKKIFNYMYGNFRKKYLKKQMIEIYQSKKPQDHTKFFIEFIESRLDAVLYKSKFATSIRNAKQLITHKNIKVNNKIEKNGSYILKQGDLISVTSKSKSILKQNLNKQIYDRPDAVLPIPPSYLNINYKTLEIIFDDITNFKFTTSFNLKLDTNSIVTNYYRH